MKVVFAPKPQYAVTYLVGTYPIGSDTAFVQDSISLPANSVEIENYEFIAGFLPL